MTIPQYESQPVVAALNSSNVLVRPSISRIDRLLISEYLDRNYRVASNLLERIIDVFKKQKISQR